MPGDATDPPNFSRLLSQHQRMLEELLDATPAVVYIKTLTGEYEFVNRKFEELFGVTRAEARTRTDFEIFKNAPHLAARFRANDTQVVTSGEAIQIQEVAPHPDGPHTYLSVKFPIRDEAGRMIFVGGISTDTTEQNETSRRLLDLQARAESILRAVGDGIIGLDASGRITFVNPAAVRILEWPSDQLVGQILVDMVQPSDGTGLPELPHECLLLEALNTGRAVEMAQSWFLTGQNDRLPVEFSCIPQLAAGLVVSAVVSFRDITIRQQRQQMQCDLQAAQEVQEHLTHTPPVIIGYDIAGRAEPANSICGDYFDFIERPTDRLVIAVGDASGHDLAAAILIVNTRAYLRGLFDQCADVDVALRKLTDALARDVHLGKFVSLFLAELDLKRSLLTYATAGHVGWLIRPCGLSLELRGNGMILGLAPNMAPVETKSIGLVTGDILLLTTDGITEATCNRQQFGAGRLIETVRRHQDDSAEAIVESLFDTVRAYSGRQIPKDDQTVVVIKVR